MAILKLLLIHMDPNPRGDVEGDSVFLPTGPGLRGIQSKSIVFRVPFLGGEEQLAGRRVAVVFESADGRLDIWLPSIPALSRRISFGRRRMEKPIP